MALLGDVLGLAVVGAEGHALRPVLLHERHERAQVARRGGLADQQPHPRAEALAPLLDRGRLVVGADAGRGVRLQILAQHAGSMAVHVGRQLEPELLELVRVAVDDAGEVHHLGEPEHAAAAQEPLQVAGRERAPRRLELRRRDGRGGHEEDVERDLVGQVCEPVHAVRAEHVGDLVRVGDDRRRAEGQDEPGELVHEQLRGLQVHVRVDEAGDDVAARARRASRGPRSRPGRRRSRPPRPRPSPAIRA